MSFGDSLILGVVEGITEFLPISSTGHLILASDLLGLLQTEFLKSFEIAIQLGAILAAVWLYWRSFLKISVWRKVLTAFAPTAAIGFILYKIVRQYLLGNPAIVLWAMLIGGLILIVFEKRQSAFAKAPADEGGIENISYRQAFWVGICQALAVVPGVSRSAATIVGGLVLGLKRTTIIEFSFLLAVPTMLAATGWDLLKSVGGFASDDFGILAVGFTVSFLTALIAIKWLLNFVQKHNFAAFGIYRILAAAAFYVFVLR